MDRLNEYLMAQERIAGPSASATYEDYNDYKYYDNGHWYNERSRCVFIKGSGCINDIVSTNRPYRQNIYIEDGITEIADGCFINNCIDTCQLPPSLRKIGNNCFVGTSLKEIKLPEGLEEIGENNFPSSLTRINIPASLKVFPFSNIANCKISIIEVPDNHPTYVLHKDILYNREMTEILYCPRELSVPVNIPSTVNRIGDFCFTGAKKIPMVMIPPTVKHIGKRAFEGMELNRLFIPNSVESVGEKCFYEIKLSSDFRFSHSVTELPEGCFKFSVLPALDFLGNIRYFGEECLYGMNSATTPVIYRLERAERISDRAFNYNKNFNVIELYPCLKYIGDDVFCSTREDLVIRSLSYAPMNLNDSAFNGLRHGILCVPEHTKRVYEHAGAWGTFGKIVEMEASKEGHPDATVDVSPEIYKRHLKGLYESLTCVDRPFLSDILNNLVMYYPVIADDSTYEELLGLLKYNRMFNPPIVSDYESRIKASWSDLYRFKLLESGLTNPQLMGMLEKCLPKPEPLSMIAEQVSILEMIPEQLDSLSPNSCEQSVVEPYFEHIQEVIEEELGRAMSKIQIAVSWFTNYRLMKLVKVLSLKGISVELIINNDAINNGGYCLDFNELLSAGVVMSLMEWPDMLHHKFCIIDGTTVITGSYNWTRFSAKNQENIVVIRNENVAAEYAMEFERLLAKAKHQQIWVMPESVPERAEYDRYAFKQYVTEDLDAAAKDIADEREKITTYHKAARINKEYLKMLSPNVESDYQEAFSVLDMQQETVQAIADIVGGKASFSSPVVDMKASQYKSSDQSTISVVTPKTDGVVCASGDIHLAKIKEVVAEIEATQLYMAVDVSGSMKETFNSGHVKVIVRKALAAALTLAKDRSVALWTFGNKAEAVGSVKLEDMSPVDKLSCANCGTELSSFVNKINETLTDGSLVIVLTDDDGNSIRNSMNVISNRQQVYWQFLSYDKNCTQIENALKTVSNASLVYMSDYSNKTDSELTAALLEGYLNFAKK